MGEHDDDLEVLAPVEPVGETDGARIAAAVAAGLERIAAAVERGLGELAAAVAGADTRRPAAKIR